MPLDLDKVVRTVINSTKENFLSNLKENLDDRLYTKMSENYLLTLNEFFSEKEEIQGQKEQKINESVKIEKNIDSLLKNLKESYFENKTILHKFRDGNTVAIAPEDSSLLIKMHDNLNIMNQDRMRKLMSESFSEYNKILKFSKKHIERTL